MCFAGWADESITNDDSFCKRIMETKPEAILYSTQDRLYLRPTDILITEHGIFVGGIKVPILMSDLQGCYYPVDSKKSNKWVCCTTYCPNFRQIFHSYSGVCPECGRQGLKYED